jgi:hypothetical protein
LGQNLATSPQKNPDDDNFPNHARFIQPYLAQTERVQEEADAFDDLVDNDNNDDLEVIHSASSDDELLDLKKKIEREKKSKEVKTHIMKMLRETGEVFDIRSFFFCSWSDGFSYPATSHNII